MAGAVAGAKRSVAARMPPLLNTHSPFTRASTFGDAKDLYHHPPTNRIGANYTPSAGPGYKQRAAKRAKVPNDEGWVNSEIITKRPLPKYPTMAEPRTSRGERSRGRRRSACPTARPRPAGSRKKSVACLLEKLDVAFLAIASSKLGWSLSRPVYCFLLYGAQAQASYVAGSPVPSRSPRVLGLVRLFR